MTYFFKWRKSGSIFYKKEKVRGHRFEEKQNKMILYLEKGEIKEIAKWTDHECFLGLDWILFTEENMKKESGQNVKIV